MLLSLEKKPKKTQVICEVTDARNGIFDEMQECVILCDDPAYKLKFQLEDRVATISRPCLAVSLHRSCLMHGHASH